jgi:hypothetical protein
MTTKGPIYTDISMSHHMTPASSPCGKNTRFAASIPIVCLLFIAHCIFRLSCIAPGHAQQDFVFPERMGETIKVFDAFCSINTEQVSVIMRRFG